MGNCLTKKEEDEKLEFFIPPLERGKVIKVYDGDTITITSKIPGLKNSKLYKFSIRLNGIDTPEIRTEDKEEKEIAIKARDFLKEIILNKIVILKNIKTEKYGRLLCDIYIINMEKSINSIMIEKRLAVKYDGGKKEKINWKEYNKKID